MKNAPVKKVIFALLVVCLMFTGIESWVNMRDDRDAAIDLIQSEKYKLAKVLADKQVLKIICAR